MSLRGLPIAHWSLCLPPARQASSSPVPPARRPPLSLPCSAVQLTSCTPRSRSHARTTIFLRSFLTNCSDLGWSCTGHKHSRSCSRPPERRRRVLHTEASHTSCHAPGALQVCAAASCAACSCSRGVLAFMAEHQARSNPPAAQEAASPSQPAWTCTSHHTCTNRQTLYLLKACIFSLHVFTTDSPSHALTAKHISSQIPSLLPFRPPAQTFTIRLTLRTESSPKGGRM